jgi:hypothetical protein
MSSTQTTSPDNADAVDVLHDVNLYGNYNRKDNHYIYIVYLTYFINEFLITTLCQVGGIIHQLCGSGNK